MSVRSISNLRNPLGLCWLVGALALAPSAAWAERGTIDNSLIIECITWTLGKVFRPGSAQAVYSLELPVLGKGGFATIYSGRMPRKPAPKILTAMRKADFSARPGDPIAVKISTPDENTPVGFVASAHEAQIMQQLAPFDPEHLMLRGFYDEDRDALVTQRDPETVTLWSFLKGKPSAAEVQKIINQLYLVEEVLEKAGIVHSDLKLMNILVNPKTLKITVIDFNISAPVGGFPNAAGKRYGTEGFMGPKQQIGMPASHDDDRWAIAKIVSILKDSL